MTYPNDPFEAQYQQGLEEDSFRPFGGRARYEKEQQAMYLHAEAEAKREREAADDANKP